MIQRLEHFQFFHIKGKLTLTIFEGFTLKIFKINISMDEENTVLLRWSIDQCLINSVGPCNILSICVGATLAQPITRGILL